MAIDANSPGSRNNRSATTSVLQRLRFSYYSGGEERSGTNNQNADPFKRIP